jgi:hypothetical protein
MRKKQSDKSDVPFFLWMTVIFIGLLAYNAPWPMPEERAYHTLEAHGFKREDVKIGGMAMFGCDHMKLRRKFTAVREGKQFEGRVCGNLLSGASVRID